MMDPPIETQPSRGVLNGTVFVCSHSQMQGLPRHGTKPIVGAEGDYIQWLDADDLLAPDKIALQVQAQRQPAERCCPLSGESSCTGTIMPASFRQSYGAT